MYRMVLLLLVISPISSAGPQPTAALVIILDRSESAGVELLASEKAAAKAAIAAMEPVDRVAVIATGDEASVVVSLQPAAKVKLTAIDGVQAASGSNLRKPLVKAYDILRRDNSQYKHVILMNSSSSHDAGLSTVVTAIADRKITVSTVSLSGADDNALSALADEGEGRLYVVGNIRSLPRILVDDVGRALPHKK